MAPTAWCRAAFDPVQNRVFFSIETFGQDLRHFCDSRGFRGTFEVFLCTPWGQDSQGIGFTLFFLKMIVMALAIIFNLLINKENFYVVKK